nr:unnamed protein product [Callosobruchus analis]
MLNFGCKDDTPNLIVAGGVYNQEGLNNLTAALSREKAEMSEDRFSAEEEKLKLQIMQSMDDLSSLKELEAAKKIEAFDSWFWPDTLVQMCLLVDLKILTSTPYKDMLTEKLESKGNIVKKKVFSEKPQKTTQEKN